MTSPSPVQNARIRCREWWGDYLAHDHTVLWPGYTAEQALTARRKRFTDAHVSTTREGLVLTVHHELAAPDGSLRREVLTFEELS